MGDKPKKIVGWFLTLGLVVLVIRDIERTAKMEWNPQLEDVQVLGLYQDGIERITLRENKAYIYQKGADNYSGIWERDDFNLILTDAETSKTQRLRFVQWNGINYIMISPPEDVDMWDGSLGLKQK